ncbi:MAG: hypothetical protein WCO49_17900 [Nostocales cyanobacterium ELA608]
MKSLEKVLNGVTIILLLIGSIALFVGGVGIANITQVLNPAIKLYNLCVLPR